MAPHRPHASPSARSLPGRFFSFGVGPCRGRPCRLAVDRIKARRVLAAATANSSFVSRQIRAKADARGRYRPSRRLSVDRYMPRRVLAAATCGICRLRVDSAPSSHDQEPRTKRWRPGCSQVPGGATHTPVLAPKMGIKWAAQISRPTVSDPPEGARGSPLSSKRVSQSRGADASRGGSPPVCPRRSRPLR
jgi:hypothetical protein